MRKSIDSSCLTKSYDIVLVGKEIDARGRLAVSTLRPLASKVYELDYDSDNFVVNIEGNTNSIIGVDDLESFFQAFYGKTILLEATTLGFVEVILSCRYLHELVDGLDILYVEPKAYRRPTKQILHKRDFELSELVNGFNGIPGFIMHLDHESKKKVVFFLGFEATRLDSLLEDFQMIRPDDSCIVFGIPSFQAGWELDAFANNIDVIYNRNFSCEIYYCGADNPASVYHALKDMYDGLRINEDERLFVAPIGTKPHGIGAALFAATKKNVGVLYDHPVRTAGRTEDISYWHKYEIVFQ